MKTITLVAIIALFLSSEATSARNPPENWGDEQGDNLPILDEAQGKALDNAQILASERLLGAAGWIDSFFDDDRVFVEENTTRATLRLSLGYSKNDEFEIKPRFDLRLRLPRLSERANLFIAAGGDEDFHIENDPLGDRLGNEDGTNNELTVGLRFFFRQTNKKNISFDTGGSWDYLYAGARYRSIQDFGEWLGRFTNRLRYYADDGLENRTTYDLEKQLHPNWLFRATASANLYEEKDGIPHSQYFRFYQVLSSHQAVSYETGLYFDTEPSYKMTDTRFLVSYRQRFFRDWLVLEVSPRVTFPEDHDCEANPGIILKLEASLGYKADEEGYRKIFR